MPASVVTTMSPFPSRSATVRAQLEALFGRALSFLVPGDTYAALELLQRTERDFQAATEKLLRMHDARAASAKDYASYEILRLNVYAVEKNLASRVRESVRNAAGADAASRIPTPEVAPAITASTPRYARGTRGTGVRGLGELGTAVLVAGVILAVIVALALTAYFVSEALDAGNQRDVTLLAEQTALLKEMYAARANYVAECVAGGSDAADCAENATELYPTPEAAGLRIPAQGEGWGWVPWAIGAAGVTLVAFFGYRVYSKERGQFRGLRGSVLPVRATKVRGKPARRALTAGARSRYGLEVR